MIAIADCNTPTNLLTWRGMTVRLSPAQDFYVYLYHFEPKYKHAGHYLGSTCFLDERLAAHERGAGARLMEVVVAAGVTPVLARLWKFETEAEARALEKTFKHRHNSWQICPLCTPALGPCPLVQLRQGHFPFQVFARPGKRQPMLTCLVERSR